MIVQIIESGTVVNCAIVADGATVSSTAATWTGGEFLAPGGSMLMAQSGAGIGWTLSGSALIPPAASTETVPLATLAASVLSAANAAGSAVLAQIYPDATHQAAGQNAAMIAAISGGAPASTSPFYAAFNSYAAVFGVTPAALAALALVLTNQSMALSAATITLQTAASAATTAAQLATALAAFEAALAGVVAAVNAVPPPVALVAPAAISIVGVNA